MVIRNKMEPNEYQSWVIFLPKLPKFYSVIIVNQLYCGCCDILHVYGWNALPACDIPSVRSEWFDHNWQVLTSRPGLLANWLAIGWLSASYQLSIGWLSVGYWLSTDWLLVAYQVAINRLLAAYQQAISYLWAGQWAMAWLWASYRLVMDWLQGWLWAGYGLAMGWLFAGYYLATSWL